jgi:aromatic-L-amino-acid decarboxylase
MSVDKAETGDFKRLLTEVGSALDEFLSFKLSDAVTRQEEWQAALAEALPEKGIGINGVTKLLTEQLIPNGSTIPKPGFTGYITTGSVTASTLATAAASVSSPQRYHLTAFNFVEEVSLNWLAQMFSLGDMKGVYSSGGSVANLVALGGARQFAFEQEGLDPAKDGINRAVSIYASDQCHHTIQRSAGVLGLGRNCVRTIETDSTGRMILDHLERTIEQDVSAGILPVAIVANAGTTNTGAIDPILEISKVAKKHSVWLHVDGAYGLPGIMDPSKAAHYDGLEFADSVIVDPHKWLGASVGVAATFVRDREILRRAFMQEPADYLEGSVEIEDKVINHSLDDFGIPYFDFGVELSSPSRGIIVWSMIKEIGFEGYRERIIRHNEIASYIAKVAVESPQLELLMEPSLSICCFRFVDEGVVDLNGFNQKLVRTLTHENKFIPTTTKVNGLTAIRPCYIGARHEISQADGLIEEVLRIGNEMLLKKTKPS